MKLDEQMLARRFAALTPEARRGFLGKLRDAGLLRLGQTLPQVGRVAGLGRRAVQAVVEFALRDLHQRNPMPEAAQHAAVHHAHVVIAPHGGVVHPFLDIEPWWLPSAARVEPAAQRAQHQPVGLDRLRLVTGHAEVGGQVRDLVAVAVVHGRHERQVVRQRQVGAGGELRLELRAQVVGAGVHRAHGAVRIRTLRRRDPSVRVRQHHAAVPQLGASGRVGGHWPRGVHETFARMRRQDKPPGQFDRRLRGGRFRGTRPGPKARWRRSGIQDATRKRPKVTESGAKLRPHPTRRSRRIGARRGAGQARVQAVEPDALARRQRQEIARRHHHQPWPGRRAGASWQCIGRDAGRQALACIKKAGQRVGNIEAVGHAESQS